MKEILSGLLLSRPCKAHFACDKDPNEMGNSGSRSEEKAAVDDQNFGEALSSLH